VKIRDFFKASKYKGVRCIDVLVQVDLKNQPDAYLISVLCKFFKFRAAEILKLNLEKDMFSLTLRLYGV